MGLWKGRVGGLRGIMIGRARVRELDEDDNPVWKTISTSGDWVFGVGLKAMVRAMEA